VTYQFIVLQLCGRCVMETQAYLQGLDYVVVNPSECRCPKINCDHHFKMVKQTNAIGLR
jgi:hypothetical protein